MKTMFWVLELQVYLNENAEMILHQNKRIQNSLSNDISSLKHVKYHVWNEKINK